MLLSDLLSSELGLHQEVGTGMLVNLVPFDHILSGHGVVFFKGTAWERKQQIKAGLCGGSDDLCMGIDTRR